MVLCQTSERQKKTSFRWKHVKVDVDDDEDDDDGGGGGSGVLFIESNGLVYIINCIAFTFLASVSKVNSMVQAEKESERETAKNYDVIRFIPSNLFVYGLWHLIFHRYRRECAPPPKQKKKNFHACVEIKVYNVPKYINIVHNHH